MSNRWLSRRALVAHLGLAIWIPACAWLAMWQFSRASSGNALSYVYAIEWPALAFFGLWGWWMLIHTDKPTDEQVAERAEQERLARAKARAQADALVGEVNDEMAAYNEQLRALNEKGRKTWKH